VTEPNNLFHLSHELQDKTWYTPSLQFYEVMVVDSVLKDFDQPLGVLCWGVGPTHIQILVLQPSSKDYEYTFKYLSVM